MKIPEIKGFIPNSLVDWDGKVSAVIFLSGCNFKCGFCSNKQLVLEAGKIEGMQFEKIKGYLKKNRDFIDGVVISGGEPTLHDLNELCIKLRELNLKIKLDTNGNKPDVLKKLINDNLVDYVAMDVKSPSYLYSKIVGNVDIKNIEESIKILSDSKIDFEFRITLAPFIDKEIRFFNNVEIEDLAKWVSGIAKNKNIRIYLQKFIARSKEEMMNEKFAVENIDEKLNETPKKLLRESQKIISKYFPCCRIRNE